MINWSQLYFFAMSSFKHFVVMYRVTLDSRYFFEALVWLQRARNYRGCTSVFAPF